MSNLDFSKYLNMGDVNPEFVDDNAGKKNIDPSEEFFHNVSIVAKARKEPALGNKIVSPGTLQIRGIDYNLNEVYMMPFFKRQILVKKEKLGNYDSVVCFSYANYDSDGKQISTCGFPCPSTSSLRREITEWCYNCKAQIILAGFFCDADGKVIRDNENKPINIFVRGYGSKFGDISSYIYECQDLEVPYLFKEKNTEETDKQEKFYFNIMRRIVKITTDLVPTYQSENSPPNQAQDRYAFVLEAVKELEPENIFQILDYANKIKDECDEKFDWSETANKNVKKIKNKLRNFQQSQTFREANPNFVAKDSHPEFMFTNEKSNKSDNAEIPSPPAQENTSDNSSIDDIPF